MRTEKAAATNLSGHNLMAFEASSPNGYSEAFKVAGDTLESLGDPYVMALSPYFDDESGVYILNVVYDLTA